MDYPKKEEHMNKADLISTKKEVALQLTLFSGQSPRR
jgi:hypothetical protein